MNRAYRIYWVRKPLKIDSIHKPLVFQSSRNPGVYFYPSERKQTSQLLCHASLVLAAGLKTSYI